jgi:hypothetical protein
VADYLNISPASAKFYSQSDEIVLIAGPSPAIKNLLFSAISVNSVRDNSFYLVFVRVGLWLIYPPSFLIHDIAAPEAADGQGINFIFPMRQRHFPHVPLYQAAAETFLEHFQPFRF